MSTVFVELMAKFEVKMINPIIVMIRPMDFWRQESFFGLLIGISFSLNDSVIVGKVDGGFDVVPCRSSILIVFRILNSDFKI